MSVSISLLRECSVAVIACVGALVKVSSQMILYIRQLSESLLAQIAGKILDQATCDGIIDRVGMPLFFFADFH